MLTAVLHRLNTAVMGPLVPAVILAVGVFYLLQLKGFFLLHPIRVIRMLWGSAASTNKGISSLKALTLALAGTLGVGNIAGVASAILIGGPGSIFWMLLSALLAMGIKYAEVVLAVLTRRSDGAHFHGGAMYYLPGKAIPVQFAGICLTASFGLGNLIQVRAAADALEECFFIPGWVTGLLFAVLTALVIGGGVQSIASFTVRLIPFLTLGYVLLAVSILLPNIDRIPAVISMIVSDALSPAAAAGGIGGFLCNEGLRIGISRGILSNEAGCGTAPIAHAEAENIKSPAQQGLWGIFEVFADTVLLCTLTAFVVLLSYDRLADCGENGMLCAMRSYMLWLGKPAEILLSVSSALFAFATVVCWAHYGLEALYFLCPGRLPRRIYIVCYVACAFAGAIVALETAWELADLCISLMALLNTAGIWLLWKRVVKESEMLLSTAPSHAAVRPVLRERKRA